MAFGFKKTSCADSSLILGDVAPEKCFWVNNGPILHNIYELSNALLSMSPETFMHHANKDKNDFGNWIRDVLHDEKLAGCVAKARKREDACSCITSRIKALEKVCDK